MPSKYSKETLLLTANGLFVLNTVSILGVHEWKNFCDCSLAACRTFQRACPLARKCCLAKRNCLKNAARLQNLARNCSAPAEVARPRRKEGPTNFWFSSLHPLRLNFLSTASLSASLLMFDLTLVFEAALSPSKPGRWRHLAALACPTT